MNADKRLDNINESPEIKKASIDKKIDALCDRVILKYDIEGSKLQKLKNFKIVDKTKDNLKDFLRSIDISEEKIAQIDTQTQAETQRDIDELNQFFETPQEQSDKKSDKTGSQIASKIIPNYGKMKQDFLNSKEPHKQVGALCLGAFESTCTIGYHGAKLIWHSIRSLSDATLILAGKAETNSFKNM